MPKSTIIVKWVILKNIKEILTFINVDLLNFLKI